MQDATPGATPTPDATPGATPGGGPAASGGDPFDRRRRRRRSGRRGSLIGGLVLVLIGGYLLIRQYLPDVDADAVLPAALVVLGAILVVSSVAFGRDGGD